MILVIDIGNTNTLIAIYKDDQQYASWRLRTDETRCSDEYFAFFLPLAQHQSIDISLIKQAVICSVVPNCDFHIRGFCQYIVGDDVFQIDKKYHHYGIDVQIEKPEILGADRFINVLAVKEHYQAPAIIIDFGTATTFDVLGEGNIYHGGVIAAGVHLSIDALSRAAAKLPRISVRKTDQIIGKNTIQAMESGVYWGYVSMVEGMIERLVYEMMPDVNDKNAIAPLVIATGGLAPLIADAIPTIQCVDQDLTLKGILAAWRIYKNQTLSLTS